jgi:hypothetical protein
MHFTSLNVILLYSDQQHVSTSHVVIFRVVSARTKNIFILCQGHTTLNMATWVAETCLWSIYNNFFYHGATASVDHGLLIVETSRSYSDTQHWVGLLCTSDQPDPENSTWQNTTLTTDKHSWPLWDSNPQSQQASGRRHTP